MAKLTVRQRNAHIHRQTIRGETGCFGVSLERNWRSEESVLVCGYTALLRGELGGYLGHVGQMLVVGRMGWPDQLFYDLASVRTQERPKLAKERLGRCVHQGGT